MSNKTPVPLAPAHLAAFVRERAPGTVGLLGGVDEARLRDCLDAAPFVAGQRRVVLLRPLPATTVEQCLDQALDALAAAARALWPSDHESTAGLLRPWAQPAARLVAAGRLPRVPGTPLATELVQLVRALEPSGGIALAVTLADTAWPAVCAVRALEWLAEHGPLAVTALFATLPPPTPPFDRLWTAARELVSDDPPLPPPAPETGAAWLAPWQGLPHPLSVTEQRLAQRLAADAELAPLFGFNLPITTRQGRHYRVDLLWPAGRLVIELDGYPDHARFDKFITDRQRDYELLLEDYCVVRLAQAEIAQDLELAVEKIRALVRWRQAQRAISTTDCNNNRTMA